MVDILLMRQLNKDKMGGKLTDNVSQYLILRLSMFNCRSNNKTTFCDIMRLTYILVIINLIITYIPINEHYS